MCIPESLSQNTSSFFSAAYAICSAVSSAAAAIWLLLASIIQKIQVVAAPLFTPPGVAMNGSVGIKPFSSHVRMLFVNGVNTTRDSCRRVAYSISNIFNGCLVHYTYIPLRYDQVIRTIMVGHRPSGCDLLLANIRARLHELAATDLPHSDSDRRVSLASHRAIEQHPRLVIFAHSGGGAMLEAIREELTPEERTQIDVYSFGSAHLFSPEEGFETVKNAVAGGDPVPTICRLMDRRITPLGEAWDIGPRRIFDIGTHSILNDIYQLAMWHIRENYV